MCPAAFLQAGRTPRRAVRALTGVTCPLRPWRCRRSRWHRKQGEPTVNSSSSLPGDFGRTSVRDSVSSPDEPPLRNNSLPTAHAAVPRGVRRTRPCGFCAPGGLFVVSGTLQSQVVTLLSDLLTLIDPLWGDSLHHSPAQKHAHRSVFVLSPDLSCGCAVLGGPAGRTGRSALPSQSALPSLVPRGSSRAHFHVTPPRSAFCRHSGGAL